MAEECNLWESISICFSVIAPARLCTSATPSTCLKRQLPEMRQMLIPHVTHPLGSWPPDHRQTGYLVPPGDEQQFSERVKSLLDDKKLRNSMSKAGREETERWSWEAATSVLRNVQYQKVSRRRSAITRAFWCFIRAFGDHGFAVHSVGPVSLSYSKIFACRKYHDAQDE